MICFKVAGKCIILIQISTFHWQVIIYVCFWVTLIFILIRGAWILHIIQDHEWRFVKRGTDWVDRIFFSSSSTWRHHGQYIPTWALLVRGMKFAFSSYTNVGYQNSPSCFNEGFTPMNFDGGVWWQIFDVGNILHTLLTIFCTYPCLLEQKSSRFDECPIFPLRVGVVLRCTELFLRVVGDINIFIFPPPSVWNPCTPWVKYFVTWGWHRFDSKSSAVSQL